MTIVASCISIIFAIFAILVVVGGLAMGLYFYYGLYYWWLFIGIFGLAAFAFGIVGGIMSLRRKNFALAIVGICLTMIQGFIVILQYGLLGYSGWAIGILYSVPITVLSLLALIFVAISKAEFD